MLQETKNLLNKIIDYGGNGKLYYVLHGGDNKIWFIPLKNTRIGMQIYSATSFKGVLLKKLFPIFAGLWIFRKIFHVDKAVIALKEEIQVVMERVCDKPELTFYIGNTKYSANRKIIIQIAENKKVLGYAKFGTEDIVLDAFRKEVKTLNTLNSKGISNIPKILWDGTVGEVCGFIQTTKRSGNEKTVFDLEFQHWAFLRKIKQNTQDKMSYADSKYAHIIHDFREDILKSNWKCRNMLAESVNYLDKYYSDKMLAVCFCHGDFTPWNICYDKKRVFVFDFEYAQDNFPIAMDIFHYITQVGILCKSASAETIFDMVMEYRKPLKDFVDNITFCYMQYLLYIIAFYHRRMKNELCEDERSCRIWIQLIELCRENGAIE